MSSSSEVSKNALYDALCSNLDRDLTELYILCEYDSNEQWIGTCLSLLNEASNTFLELQQRVNELNNAGQDGKSIAWEMPPHRTPHKVAAHSRIRAMLDRMTEEHEQNLLVNQAGVTSSDTEIIGEMEISEKATTTPTTPTKSLNNVNSGDNTVAISQSTTLQTPSRVVITASSSEIPETSSTTLRTPVRTQVQSQSLPQSLPQSQSQAQSPSRSITSRPSVINDRPAPVIELLTQLESGGLSWGDMMMDEDESLLKQKSINAIAANSPSLKGSNGLSSPPFVIPAETLPKILSISLPPTLSRSARLDDQTQSIQPNTDLKSESSSSSPPSIVITRIEAANSTLTISSDSSGSVSNVSNNSNNGTFGFTPQSMKFKQLSKKFGITSGSDSLHSNENVSSSSTPLFVWQIASQRDRSATIDNGQRTLLKKLSSPERHRPSAEETARKAEQRQAAAEAKRFSMQEEKRAFLEEQSRRSANATLRVQERQDEIASSVQSRIEAAQKRYSEVLRTKVLTAESELLKVKEVTAIQRQESETRKAAMQEHLDNASQRADEILRLRKTKAGEHVSKVHESLQNLKDSQIAESAQRREELDRKLAEGELRRQTVLSNRKTYGAALTGSRTGVIDLMGSAATSPGGEMNRVATGMNVSAAAFFAAAAAATVAVGAAPQSIASAAAAASMAAEVANQESKSHLPEVSGEETPNSHALQMLRPSEPVQAANSAVHTSSSSSLHESTFNTPSAVSTNIEAISSQGAVTQDISNGIESDSTYIKNVSPSPTSEVLNSKIAAVVSVPITPISILMPSNPWKQKYVSRSTTIISPPSSSVITSKPVKVVDLRNSMLSSSSSSSSSSSLSSTLSSSVVPTLNVVSQKKSKTSQESQKKSKTSQESSRRSKTIPQPKTLTEDIPLVDKDEQWIEVKTTTSSSRAPHRVGAPLPAAGNVIIKPLPPNLRSDSSIDDVKTVNLPLIDVSITLEIENKRIIIPENSENIRLTSDIETIMLPESTIVPILPSERNKSLKLSAVSAVGTSSASKTTAARRKKLKKLLSSVFSSGISFYQASGSVTLRSNVSLKSSTPSSLITRAVTVLQKASANAIELEATDDWEALELLHKNNNGADNDENGHVVFTLGSITPELDLSLRDLFRALEGGRSTTLSSINAIHSSMVLATLRNTKSPLTGSAGSELISSLFRMTDEPLSEGKVSLPFSFSDLQSLWCGSALSLTAKCVSKDLFNRSPRSVSHSLKILALCISSPCKGPREWVLSKGLLGTIIDVCSASVSDIIERFSSSSETCHSVFGNDDLLANSLVSCLQILWIVLQQPSEFSTQTSLVAAETAIFQYFLASGLIPQLLSLLKVICTSSYSFLPMSEPICISILSFILVALKRPAFDSSLLEDRSSLRPIFSTYSRSDLPVYTDTLVSTLTSNGVEMLTLVDIVTTILTSKTHKQLQFHLQSILIIIQCFSWLARLDLKAVQTVFSTSEFLEKFLQMNNLILDLVLDIQSQLDVNTTTTYLVQEHLLFIGFVTLGNKALQDCFGQSTSDATDGLSTLKRLLALPKYYFVEESHFLALFPTLLVLADTHEKNQTVIKESSARFLISKFVDDNQARLDAIMDAEGPGGLVGNDDLDSVNIQSALRLEFRLPPARWAAACAYLK